MWTKLESYLTSLRLTLTLLLGIAFVAIWGTLKPVSEGRFDLFYQNFGFRLLLGLLALNLIACTLKTIRRNLGDEERLFTTLQETSGSDHPLPGCSLDEVKERLQGHGYRVLFRGLDLIACRGTLGRWGSTVVHLSFLLIMFGALCAGFGHVGTVNLYVGDKSSTYFDWHDQEDRSLGYDFRLDHFEPIYYPIDLQFVALDPKSKEVIETYTTREGETVQLPNGLVARVVRFFPLEEDLVLDLSRHGRPLGEYHALGGKKEWENRLDLEFIFKPAAYRDPLLKQLHSKVSILKDGQVVKQGEIEINHPLEYDGTLIYQTVYNRDKFGFWSAGFQFSHDPGKPLVWIGCIALMAGLLLAFLLPYRTVGIRKSDNALNLVPLTGFRGEGGAVELAALIATLTRSTHE